MEHLDLLNKIIEAEQTAKQISSQAKEKRDNLPSDLRAQQERLHEEYLARAQKRVSMVEREENQAASERVQELEKELIHDKAAMEDYFRAHHETLTDGLFQMVVNPTC